MNPKIVIIGAGGMLGQALSQVLVKYQPVLWRHNDVDITNQTAVQAAIIALRPDVIVNAAAYTAVDLCETNEAVAELVNGAAVKHIAEAARSVQAKLIHISTDYVFAGDQVAGYTEDYADRQPVNAYGRSKLAGELAIAATATPDWNNWYIIRTAWLYGTGGKNFVDTIVAASQTKDRLKVVNDQVGSPTYVVDLATQVKYIIEHAMPFGIYHATNMGTCSWYEFAKAIVELTGRPTTVEPCTSAEFPRPAKRPAFSILLNTKLPPLPDWRLALARYLASQTQPQ